MRFGRGSSSGGAGRFPAEWLVVGLGNPGESHARNRHNVGFWVINELAKRAHVQPKAVGQTMAIAVGTLAGHRVALVKPRTFVNLSGTAVAQALRWSETDLPHTVVIYDELDLAAGAIRIRRGGGHGGHNGLKSIAAHAGLDFVRIRIGIGRPEVGGEPTWDPEVVASWVLGNPFGADLERLNEAVQLAADAVVTIMDEDAEAAANRFNRR